MMVQNPIFKRTYSQLVHFDQLDREEQLLRLIDALIYAYKCVPYYKEIFDNVGFEPEQMKFGLLHNLYRWK